MCIYRPDQQALVTTGKCVELESRHVLKTLQRAVLAAAQRRDDQLSRELELQDELVSKIVAVDIAAASDVSEGENPARQPKSSERFAIVPRMSEKSINVMMILCFNLGLGVIVAM